MLSQPTPSDQKLHPSAFFSTHLSQAKQNYSISERKLLAKLALEKWRHLLEGSSLLFVVLTDHKNLENLRTTKRLNPLQASWALFLDSFDFSLSFHPGTKNGQADSLLRLHSSVEDLEEPKLDMSSWTRARLMLLRFVKAYSSAFLSCGPNVLVLYQRP